jgi:hypothetical protein
LLLFVIIVDEKRIGALMKDFFEFSSNGRDLSYNDLKRYMTKQKEKAKVSMRSSDV